MVPERVCPTCGYSLAGLPAGAICPECGKGRVKKRQRPRDTAHHWDSLIRLSTPGRIMCLGWGIIVVGYAVTWLAYMVSLTLYQFQYEYGAVIGGAVAVLGALMAFTGGIKVLLVSPPREVIEAHQKGTRILSLGAPILWAIMAAWIGAATVTDPSNPPLSALILALPAALLTSCHCRVAGTIAWMTEDDAQRALHAGVVGVPICVVILCVGAWWVNVMSGVVFSRVGTYVFAMLTTGLGGSMPLAVAHAHWRLADRFKWAERGERLASERDARRIARWQQQAALDKEHERRHGNSAGL